MTDIEYNDIVRFILFIGLCMIETSSCFDEEKEIACPRENMTGLKSLCTCACGCRGPHVEDFIHNYVVCSDVTEVPNEIPYGVKGITITDNNITELKKGDFNNLPRLFKLYLTDNKIRIIEPGSFVNLTNSELLIYLGNNNLSILTADMFADISLNVLFLYGNPITVIEKHAFVNLPFLISVNGIFPFLEEIETEAFVNLSAAALTLELYRNNATVIQKNAFKNVQIDGLVLSGNSTIKENRLITFGVRGGMLVQIIQHNKTSSKWRITTIQFRILFFVSFNLYFN